MIGTSNEIRALAAVVPDQDDPARPAWRAAQLLVDGTAHRRLYDIDDDPIVPIGDLIADLMHLCRALELPFEDALEIAHNQYDEETQ